MNWYTVQKRTRNLWNYSISPHWRILERTIFKQRPLEIKFDRFILSLARKVAVPGFAYLERTALWERFSIFSPTLVGCRCKGDLLAGTAGGIRIQATYDGVWLRGRGSCMTLFGHFDKRRDCLIQCSSLVLELASVLSNICAIGIQSSPHMLGFDVVFMWFFFEVRSTDCTAITARTSCFPS